MLKLNSVARVGLLFVTAIGASIASAQEKLTAPPYVLTGFETIATGVTWDEAAVRAALPAGVVTARTEQWSARFRTLVESRM